MSRQASFETDIVAKNFQALEAAVEYTCKELNGKKVDQIPYYSGKVLGMHINKRYVGVITDRKDKIKLVGEDYHLHNEAFRNQILKALKKNYTTASIVRVAKKLGLCNTTVKIGAKNIVKGAA